MSLNRFQSNISTFLKGMAMGAADAIPGVSGGTIALISGIYEKLINSLKAFDLKAVSFLRRFQIKGLWRHINGSFLITLGLGILISLFSLANLVTYLIRNHPIQLWSFFFGLILISSVVILREVKGWSILTVIALGSGTLVAYYLTELSPASTTNAPWFVFISGATAICAMILPGISGAFILLILGKYEYIIGSLKNLDFTVIAVFAFGCIVGIISFSRVVSWLLKSYHGITIAILSGFMLGSLNKIWPWKVVTLYRENSNGEQIPLLEENILPGKFAVMTNQDPLLLHAILFAALGILIVISLERASRSNL